MDQVAHTSRNKKVKIRRSIPSNFAPNAGHLLGMVSAWSNPFVNSFEEGRVGLERFHKNYHVNSMEAKFDVTLKYVRVIQRFWTGMAIKFYHKSRLHHKYDTYDITLSPGSFYRRTLNKV